MNGYAARLALLRGLEATYKWAMQKQGCRIKSLVKKF